jgi:hypothetical protein
LIHEPLEDAAHAALKPGTQVDSRARHVRARHVWWLTFGVPEQESEAVRWEQRDPPQADRASKAADRTSDEWAVKDSNLRPWD